MIKITSSGVSTQCGDETVNQQNTQDVMQLVTCLPVNLSFTSASSLRFPFRFCPFCFQILL